MIIGSCIDATPRAIAPQAARAGRAARHGAHRLAIGVAALAPQILESLPWPLWQTCVAIFVVAWVGQFIGHAVEGKRPSFFKDLLFLLVGPLWLLAFVYRALGVPYRLGVR